MIAAGVIIALLGLLAALLIVLGSAAAFMGNRPPRHIDLLFRLSLAGFLLGLALAIAGVVRLFL